MLSLIAFSLQAAFAAVHGPNPTNNPNIIVPPSSMPHWYDKPGTMHTTYLIVAGSQGIKPTGDSTPPEESIFGPLDYAQGGGLLVPQQMHAAYKVPNLSGSQAIAIVDAFGYPEALSDFNVFCNEFGLPPETSTDPTSSSNRVLQVVYEGGTQPAGDSGWAGEQSLDIQWAHAMAPNAKIYLVEAQTPGSLFNAEQIAESLVGVKEVSNSWGSGEWSGEIQQDSVFQVPGVTFYASSGDSPFDLIYPSTSPYVVGVGGTSLYMSGLQVDQETGWNSEGGGTSNVEAQPAYQQFLAAKHYSARVTPDIAADADPGTGVYVYNSEDGGWLGVGGTSLASPLCAAMNNVYSTTEGAWANSTTSLLTQYYGWLGSKHFRDIVQGNNGFLFAGAGWDNMTGVGAPLWVSPVTLTIPDPGAVSATAGGTVSYPFAATDTAHPGVTINASVMHGAPAWVSWNGTTLTISPPAGLAVGSYPIGLMATEPSNPVNTVSEALFITISAPKLKSATWSKSTVVGGGSDTLTITLTNPAPAGGITLSLANPTAVVQVPATVVVPAGASSVTVNATTSAVTISTYSVVRILYGSVQTIAPLRIIP